MKEVMSHSEFIRNHHNLSVKDLILEASKKGLTIKKNFIYNLRSKDRHADGATPAAGKVKKASKKSVVKAKAVATAKPGKKASKKAKVAVVRAASAPVVAASAPVVASRTLGTRKAGNGSKYTLTVTLDVHDPSSLKNSKGLISSLFSN